MESLMELWFDIFLLNNWWSLKGPFISPEKGCPDHVILTWYRTSRRTKVGSQVRLLLFPL